MSRPFKTAGSPHWQYDVQRRGRRFRGSTGTANKTAAQAFINRLIAEIASGEYDKQVIEAQKESITVTQALGHYWLHVAEAQPSAGTTLSQMRALREGLGRVASYPMHELTQSHLMDYRRARRAVVAEATVNRDMQCLRRAINWCVKNRGANGPSIDWTALRLKEATERIRWLTDAEETALLEALREDLLPLFLFCLWTGVRVTGARTLLWQDVDLKARQARVRLKGGKTQVVHLTPQTMALIAAQPRDVPPSGPRVFTYLSRGKTRAPITKDGWRKPWAQALAAAGVANFRWHDIRHTTATRLRRFGADLKLVQQILGHADLASTARYAHVAPDDQADVMDRMEASRSTADPQNSPRPEAGSHLKVLK
jgi:integrase